MNKHAYQNYNERGPLTPEETDEMLIMRSKGQSVKMLQYVFNASQGAVVKVLRDNGMPVGQDDLVKQRDIYRSCYL